MALQAMKDSILNEIVLIVAIAREASHRDPGDPTFLEGSFRRQDADGTVQKARFRL